MLKSFLMKPLSRGCEVARQFMYGLTGHEFARHAVELRRERESLFMVITLGDLLGLPVLPPIYSLRFLPYVLPRISAWKRDMARPKEPWEKEAHDLHGI
jgi:hypothetical protein